MKLTDDRISKRTQILIHILRFNRKHNRPVSFTELKKISKMPHNMVSKCEDSLSDMGLIETQWFITDNNMHTQGFIISPSCIPFVEKVEKSIRNEK